MGTFHRLTYHIVFGTRFRRPSIHPVFRERLYEYIGGIIRAQSGHLIQIGGIEDHIHLLVNLAPSKAVSDVLRDIKANSAKWSTKNISLRKVRMAKGIRRFHGQLFEYRYCAGLHSKSTRTSPQPFVS